MHAASLGSPTIDVNRRSANLLIGRAHVTSAATIGDVKESQPQLAIITVRVRYAQSAAGSRSSAELARTTLSFASRLVIGARGRLSRQSAEALRKSAVEGPVREMDVCVVSGAGVEQEMT